MLGGQRAEWGDHMGRDRSGDKGSPKRRGCLALRREGGLVLMQHTVGFVPEGAWGWLCPLWALSLSSCLRALCP